MNSQITSKDISVVIRGLIVGKNDINAKRRFTERCIASIRRHLPEAEIILSTWTDQDTDSLDYDILVLNEPPKEIFMVHSGGEVRRITTNNQLITSGSGGVKATRPYILNIRSDIELYGSGFIKMFQTFNSGAQTGHFRKKIVVLPTYNPRRGRRFLFNVCDWFYFGVAADIRDLFDIPLLNSTTLKGARINNYHPVEENFGCEAYIWTQWLEKHGEQTVPNQAFWSTEAFLASERSYAQNSIMAPAHLLNIRCLKMPRAGYGARPWLSQGLYTFNEYKHLYNLYHEPKISIRSNPFEEILYRSSLNIRRFVASYAPNLHQALVNLVRKSNGSYNLVK